MPEMPSGENCPQIRVLIVDHHLAFLRAATRLLQEQGDVVVARVVHDGEQALACAAELDPDVVLFDLGMPDLSRLKMISRLRTVLPRACIIALTSLGSDGQRSVVRAVGADALVYKATVSTDLLPAIRRAAHGRMHRKPGRREGARALSTTERKDDS